MEFAEAHWRGLEEELEAWAAVGREATLWWRDDDAEQVTPALESMMALARRFEVPLALATVPRDAERSLAGAMAERCTVVQHGWAHANHAPPGEKSAEFGAHRPIAERREELAAGRARLEALFPSAFAPVFVPPWNRMDDALAAALPAIGLTGLSTFSPRAREHPHAALKQVNCHVDPIDWRAGARFRGERWSVLRVRDVLSARRSGDVDADEATGVLTHHLRHDGAMWQFLERLFGFLARPGVPARWLTVAEAFAA